MKIVLFALALLGSSVSLAATSEELLCIFMVDGRSIFELKEPVPSKPKSFEKQIFNVDGKLSVSEGKAPSKDAKPVGMFQISYTPKESAGWIQVMMKSFGGSLVDVANSSFIIPKSEVAFDMNASGGGLFAGATKSASVRCKR